MVNGKDGINVTVLDGGHRVHLHCDNCCSRGNSCLSNVT